jgi:nifR3 family TIM-barrel protein
VTLVASALPATSDRRHPVDIGPLSVWPPVVLAPMAGVTNAPFRTLCRRFGAGLYVGQMVTARAIVEGHPLSMKLTEFAPDESPRSIQLYGTEAASIAEATRRLVDRGQVDHIDLNFGCPAKKVTRHGGGAALPVKRRLLRAIVAATVEAAGPVPVTIKFRKGIDDDNLTYLDAGRIAQDEGCAAVSLHARTSEQFYSGTADWDAITELKGHVSIPVLGNGDIWDATDALAMMRQTGCDGVVIGRGCLGRPWLFGELAAAFEGRPAPTPPTLGEVRDIMTEHLHLLVEWIGERRAVREFRKFTGWYLKGYPVGPEIRRSLNQMRSPAELRILLDTVDPSIEFPAEAARMPRGHTAGPRPVALPEGWLTDPDEAISLGHQAEALVSGG